MGRQIAEAEGTKLVEEERQDDADADGNEAEVSTPLTACGMEADH
jgi:hypothetical protein